MKGSTKQEREIYEQFIILEKYGGDISRKGSKGFHNLLNKVNPVGGRYDLKTDIGVEALKKKARELAKRWDLPTEFEPVILN
ncbi:hypothetical protein [Aquimarina longa]|uniref:hypothetical protein n=1 Tax=Aquimarina longa TaxID=1080221 RepID=UPI000785353D|nr:hypothetical protein [Aquimarina longa]